MNVGVFSVIEPSALGLVQQRIQALRQAVFYILL